jgi:hypothetical protein
MRNGPSLGYSYVENGSHPVSAALDFLDEGSGSFCGDTYYLRYLDNSSYILYLIDIGAMGTLDRVSVRSIFKHPPWGLCDDVQISGDQASAKERAGCLRLRHVLRRCAQ